ncbi:hypothetical protein FRC02_007235 [Tulasnella sp. 418]|nr:hypothetical protein FRC02_007235 [Tulasnella sp. 418]
MSAWKGGFIRDAAAERIALVFPDTSPRGAGVEGEDADWDFGTGAGFYINASVEKFSRHYNMYSHIVDEIPQVIQTLAIPLDTKKSSIFGHSMGGHGALTLYLRNLDKYLSASAFAPITNPSNPDCQWGQKAFKGYFSNGVEEGKSYDATELIRIANSRDLHLLVDYGDADNFYKQGQLLPENFAAAARDAGFDETLVNVRCQPGYDHSYYFISTFASEHIRYHAKFLRK